MKESYLLLANSYGFLVHPYLTLKKISRDRSQKAIFLTLLGGGWLGVLLLLFLGWVVSFSFPQLSLLKQIFLAMAVFGGIFLLGFTVYLGYWLIVFWRRK